MSGSTPFEPVNGDTWVQDFLNCESVLKGHVYAFCDPNPPTLINRMAVLSQLVHDINESAPMFLEFAQEVYHYGTGNFGKDEPLQFPDEENVLWARGRRHQVSERQMLIQNPDTAMKRASEIWNWGIVNLFRVRAGKHEVVQMDDVSEDLRDRIDALLSGVNKEAFRHHFDPRREGTRRWGQEVSSE